MITEVLTQDGRKISAEEAVCLRDEARRLGQEVPNYIDSSTGDTLIRPRKGHDTLLSHARTHFYHPFEVREEGIGTERSIAISQLEEILDRTDEIVEFRKGVLEFCDIEMALKYDAKKPDFDYGFQVLWARKSNGKEYALLVLNRVPNSDKYLGLLKSLGNRELFEGKPKIKKRLIDRNGDKTELGDTIYLATIQLRNKHLFRPNKEESHPENAIMLGDWQTRHLSVIYPEFVYFSSNTKNLEVVQLRRFSHACMYSRYRYEFKDKAPPIHGPEFCQLAESQYGVIDRFTLKPFEIKKDSLKEDIGEHPRLYLATVIPLKQKSLF